jgi:hypothetical protein
MPSWIRLGAIVGAVAIFLGLVGVISTTLFFCFDNCPPDISGAIVSRLARWLSLGLVVTGCAWILSLLESARGGQWRWFAVLLLSLPMTVVVTEAVLWIADGGIAGGWLVPQFESEFDEWKGWGLLLLLCWPLVIFLVGRALDRIGRVGPPASTESSSAWRGRVALGALGSLLVTVVVGGFIANQGAATHLSTLQGWLTSLGTSAHDQGAIYHRSALLVPGHIMTGVNSSQTIEAYEYPLAALAARDAALLRPSDLQPAGAPYHVFYRGRLIVVYQGDDGGTLFLLTGLLGPQLASASTASLLISLARCVDVVSKLPLYESRVPWLEPRVGEDLQWSGFLQAPPGGNNLLCEE